MFIIQFFKFFVNNFIFGGRHYKYNKEVKKYMFSINRVFKPLQDPRIILFSFVYSSRTNFFQRICFVLAICIGFAKASMLGVGIISN